MKDVLELEIIKKNIGQYAQFSLGQRLVLNQKPVYERMKIERMLSQTKQAMQILSHHGSVPFGGIHDIREAVAIAQKDVCCTEKELYDCAMFMKGCQTLSDFFKHCETEKDEIMELVDSMLIDLSFCKVIERCISPNYEVMDDASLNLKRIRRKIQSIHGEIASKTAAFIQANASKLTDTITTMRNDRVCVLVKTSEKNTIRGFIHGESASGATAYVEPESLLILNNQLQTLKSEEQDEIKRILFECSQHVKKMGDALVANCETAGLLDSIFAKAQFGLNTQGCVAVLDNDRKLYIKRARHPLIDPLKVVANTYSLKDHSMLLITGSNTGGKTVTMKTIGLFVLMTYCGFPICADEAIIPMFDAVYVDIGDEQSIEQSLSTFSAHISKLARILKKATSHSLVILDELGSGTDPKEGEALAIALLEKLRDIGCMVLASTHYSKLKAMGGKWEDVLTSSVEFDMEKMQPTYRYVEGISGASNALSIAAHFGLDASVLKRAKTIKDENETDEEKTMEKLTQLMNENLRKEEQLRLMLEEVQKEKQLLFEKEEKLQKEKDSILQNAKEERDLIIEEAKYQSNEIIARLKNSENVKYHELLQIKNELNELEEEQEEEEKTQEEVFKANDSVLIKKYNYYGEVLEVKPKYLLVLANGMKMKLDPSECTHTAKRKEKKQQISISNRSTSTMSLECNVIGERVADALGIVDRYLDSAILKRLSVVRIIHGVGSGALRSAIWEYLKKNKHVESFRIGGEGEGGTGATVVTLKGRKS